MKAKLAATSACLAFALAISGCASIGRTPAPAAEPGMISELVFPSEASGAIGGLVNYNYLATNQLTTTWIYEPLMIRDTFSCEMRPWLATSYEFTDPTTLVFQIRKGVKWSDGEDFTPADVVFTYEMAKKYPGADKAGLWSDTLGGKALSVTAEGDTVVIKFDAPAPNKLDDLVQTMKILPEHVYSTVGDVTKYIDEKPVGTGPFTVGDYNGRRLTLLRNPNYWQADQIKVQQLVLEGQYPDPNAAALKLRNGDLDIFTGDVPNPARSVRRAGATDFYYAPAGTTVIAPNNSKDGPTGDPKFREALAYGVDKQQATLKATYDVMKPASQTMLKLPVQEAALPAQYKESQGYIPYDAARAGAMLDAAGYKMGPDGLRTDKDGKPFSMVFSVQAGYVDYLAIVDTVVRNWKALGIDIRQIATDPNAVDAQKKSGDFDFLLEYVPGGCVRSRDFGTRLATSSISDGKEVGLNNARYSDPEVDKTVQELEATTDPAAIKTGTEKLIDVFMTDFPYIAVNYAPSRLVYRDATTTGWPNDDNPYPVDNMLYVMTQIRPKA